MKRFELINSLIETFNYRRYLEIGVSVGDCFRQVRAVEKVGVDPCDSKEHIFVKPDEWYLNKINNSCTGVNIEDTARGYRCTSDEYFEKYVDGYFDIIFIDGLHHSEQVDKDIRNALLWLNPYGTIVCHDLNPQKEEHQTIPIHPGIWNGDCWKSLVRLRLASDIRGIEVFTVATDEGCGIIRFGKQEPLVLPDYVTKLEYRWLDKFRTDFLNLINVEQFREWLDKQCT